VTVEELTDGIDVATKHAIERGAELLGWNKYAHDVSFNALVLCEKTDKWWLTNVRHCGAVTVAKIRKHLGPPRVCDSIAHHITLRSRVATGSKSKISALPIGCYIGIINPIAE